MEQLSMLFVIVTQFRHRRFSRWHFFLGFGRLTFLPKSRRRMTDKIYNKPHLAELYDLFNPWAADSTFYQQLTDLPDAAILDLGCGTGLLTVELGRRASHVTGVDPAQAMLSIARERQGNQFVQWQLGDARTIRLCRKYDRIVCTGHAFQVFLSDTDQHSFLQTAHEHLAPDGLLAFETRNPKIFPWLQWTSERTRCVQHPLHGEIELFNQFKQVSDNLVTFDSVYRFTRSGESYVDQSTLRFTPCDALLRMLEVVGFQVDAVFGDWDRSPLKDDSREIIVIARHGTNRS
jgi:2-polyprenyl-3-methyl-5-hydroxy-6-metoxy-1,4-benzoquinol methylase